MRSGSTGSISASGASLCSRSAASPVFQISLPLAASTALSTRSSRTMTPACSWISSTVPAREKPAVESTIAKSGVTVIARRATRRSSVSRRLSPLPQAPLDSASTRHTGAPAEARRIALAVSAASPSTRTIQQRRPPFSKKAFTT